MSENRDLKLINHTGKSLYVRTPAGVTTLGSGSSLRIPGPDLPGGVIASHDARDVEPKAPTA